MYAYNAQVHQETGRTPFNLSITRPPPCPIVHEISIAAPADLNETPSFPTMRARILSDLTTKCGKTDSRFNKTPELYKK